MHKISKQIFKGHVTPGVEIAEEHWIFQTRK